MWQGGRERKPEPNGSKLSPTGSRGRLSGAQRSCKSLSDLPGNRRTTDPRGSRLAQPISADETTDVRKRTETGAGGSRGQQEERLMETDVTVADAVIQTAGQQCRNTETRDIISSCDTKLVHGPEARTTSRQHSPAFHFKKGKTSSEYELSQRPASGEADSDSPSAWRRVTRCARPRGRGGVVQGAAERIQRMLPQLGSGGVVHTSRSACKRVTNGASAAASAPPPAR